MSGFLLLLSIASPCILKPALGAGQPILAVKGDSVQLSVQTNLIGMDIDYIVWRFNIEQPVVKYSHESKNPLKVYKEYAARAEVDPTTYSLILHNLTEQDNGTYRAKIMDHHGYEKDVATYTLAVYEAVPDLDFNMMLLYYNSTEGYCNVSVKCLAEDSFVSYTCDMYGCVEDQVELLKPFLLMSISISEDTVACNASNLVSAKSLSGRMSDVCTEEVEFAFMALLLSVLRPTMIVLDVAASIFLIGVFLYCLLIRPKHTGDLKTMELKSKSFLSSVQLVHVHEFDGALKDPTLPEYLQGAAIYSISRGRIPALPSLGLIKKQNGNTNMLDL